MPDRGPQARPEPDFHRIREVLERCVRKACPPDLVSQVDDIVQRAVARLVERVREADGELDFGSGYLWQVANHAVIDELRRRRPRREDPTPDTDALVGSAGDPERSVHDRQITAGIDSCLEGIVSHRRAALGLYLQGLSIPEVAVALRCNPKRADNLIYRGLAALRKCLLAKGIRP
ncbi:MAG: sigma-70 family RNA polymerase sigma factor [Nannocystaceae bacterium]